jgi:DNA-3-methyladenine glycosylase I
MRTQAGGHTPVLHVASDLEHAAFLIQKQHINGEFHADGVNCLAGRDPQSFAWFEAGVFQESSFSRFASVGDAGAVCQQRVARLVPDAKSGHGNSIIAFLGVLCFTGSVMRRCHWARGELDILYHDEEWGVPLHDDRKLFEFLILEGAQAGLSWSTILAKRKNYRKAFDRFDASKMARYDSRKVASLLEDSGIVRNRLKIAAAVQNAKAFLKIQDEGGTFDAYTWKFVGGKPKLNRWRSHAEVPAETPESDSMSKDLRGRGFKFVGSTICYAYMQAVGMVNDHELGCFRRTQIGKASAVMPR